MAFDQAPTPSNTVPQQSSTAGKTVATTGAAETTPTWITIWKDAAEASESTATALALIVGAIWTYFIFIKNRIRYPRANVEHRVEHWSATADRVIVHVTVRVANPGGVLLRLSSIEIRLQQLLPTPDAVRNPVERGVDPVRKGQSEVLWPLLDEKTLVKNPPAEIEPGESDEYHFDFVIPVGVESIEVYSYLKNAAKGRNIGWNVTTIYRLGVTGGPTAEAVAAPQTPATGEQIRLQPNAVQRQAPPKPMPERADSN